MALLAVRCVFRLWVFFFFFFFLSKREKINMVIKLINVIIRPLN